MNLFKAMSKDLFQFKQFAIQQNKSAMKVGTDGVLLGAWMDVSSNPYRILDIGSGTGLIALMMAQRTHAEYVDAVELNPSAYEQTVENFESSDWGDRLFCYHASFQEFANEIEDEYDLIISNPPFYSPTSTAPSQDRTMARHTISLPYPELLEGTSKLLSKNGECAFIIPFIEEERFIDIAKEFNLIPNRITRVKGNRNAKIKRSLIQLSFLEKGLELTELEIEISRHNYTEPYINLVKDFYLNMK